MYDVIDDGYLLNINLEDLSNYESHIQSQSINSTSESQPQSYLARIDKLVMEELWNFFEQILQQSSPSLRHVVPHYSKIRNSWLKTVTSFKILTNYFSRRYFHMVFIKYFICCTCIFIHVFLFVSYHVDLKLSFGNARLHQT